MSNLLITIFEWDRCNHNWVSLDSNYCGFSVFRWFGCQNSCLNHSISKDTFLWTKLDAQNWTLGWKIHDCWGHFDFHQHSKYMQNRWFVAFLIIVIVWGFLYIRQQFLLMSFESFELVLKWYQILVQLGPAGILKTM